MTAGTAGTPTPGATLDLLYPSGFYSFQTPLLLDYVAALNGWASPAAAGTADFTYGDLGCGDGFTLILLAAIYPHCRFVGIDLNPGHIARGAALIAAAGLTNVRLIEGGFADWRSLDLPVFDYVALHGVYAWIAETDRHALQALLADRLSANALVYLGYNAWPGWAAIAPMRHMLLGLSAGARGASGEVAVEGVRAALAQLQRLKERGAAYFAQNPAAAHVLDDMLGRNIRYVAHEIHTPHWSPLPFAQMAEDMAAAGLAYVGSADLGRNFSAFSVPAALSRTLDEAPAGTPRETLRDCIANTFFRRDVFGRGPVRGKPDLGVQLFGAKIDPSEMTMTIPSPGGPVSLAGEPFAALRERLGRGTATLRQLQQAMPRLTQDQMIRLTLGFQVAPFLQPSRLPDDAPHGWTIPIALNRLLMTEPMTEDPFVIVISPIAGNGIPLAFADALILLAVEADATDPAAWAERQPEALRNRLKLDGKLIRDASGYKAAFHAYREIIAPRLRKLEELGIIRRC